MASYDGESYEDEDEALDELAYEAAEGPGSRMGADGEGVALLEIGVGMHPA